MTRKVESDWADRGNVPDHEAELAAVKERMGVSRP